MKKKELKQLIEVLDKKIIQQQEYINELLNMTPDQLVEHQINKYINNMEV